MNIKSMLPQGIRLRSDTSLAVQTRKRVNGVVLSEYATIEIKYCKDDTMTDRQLAFNDALSQAIHVKEKQIAEMGTKGYNGTLKKRVKGVGTLKDVHDELFETKWKGKANEKNHCMYMQDIYLFFPPDTKLKDMQNKNDYDGFCNFVEKRILERPKNNLQTFNTRSLNHRLSVLRCIFEHAISTNVLQRSDMLNPNPSISSMGWSNKETLESKSKDIISHQVEKEVIEDAIAMGDQEFVDAFQFLINGFGMRISEEFCKLTVDSINFRENTINFYRNKTKKWSKSLPLNDTQIEIVNRYKESAFARADKKLFPNMTVYRLRERFDYYGKRLRLNNFTPYCTKHTYITRLAQVGTPVKTLVALAGISIGTAQKHYEQATDETMKDAMSKINQPSNISTMVGHNSKVLKN